MFASLKTVLLASVAVVGLAGAAGAATITNGSFEGPGTFTGQYTGLTAVSAYLPGWTVSAGSVDLIHTYWQNADGNYSLDMDGVSAGTITQSVGGLDVGHKYVLSFALAGNPDRGPALKTLLASMGSASGTYTFDTTGKTRSNMGWVIKTLAFTASDTTETLSFASNTPGSWGPALDNVSLSEVPVPAAGLLLLTAFGGLAALRRRKA